jgi:hypothetical protein
MVDTPRAAEAPAWLALAAILLLLPGCVQRAPAAPPDSVHFSLDLAGLHMSRCHGFLSSTTVPRATAPGTAPPGWEPRDKTQPEAYVFLLGLACNRVAVGPLERGPVSLLLESHSNADIPPACAGDKFTESSVMVASLLLVNDTGLAAYLRDALGLPSQVADIREESSATPAMHPAWAWAVGTGASSTLTVTDAGGKAASDAPDRFLWAHGNGTGMLDLTYVTTGPQGGSQTAYGRAEAPMLLAGQPDGRFTGTAQSFTSVDADGGVRFYRDGRCAHPEDA